ncbi:MAG: caspase family protein [Methanosarcinaceae archaeon]|nr:caspase family protein [Methanosarcinaceae archaeon]
MLSTKHTAMCLHITTNLYSGSKALLIGITDFEDKNFATLPYINEDLTFLEEALMQNGFSIKKLEGAITREQVFTAIEDMIASASENDRIIIYFSSHGFQDYRSPTEGYIACSDCEKDRPTVNCLSLSYLDTVVKNCIAKPVKHILIIIDSCFAGLGVLTKTTEYPDIARIATKEGAHMMTAGMAEQEAQMDHQLKKSIFTYYITQGMSGEADYTNDGIITLTELHLFVQYEVARKTKGFQIPMIGRIAGQGEMIFDKR